MISHDAAVVQLQSGSDPAANLERAVELCRRAVDQGARLVALPEAFAGIGAPGAGRAWAFEAGREGASAVVRPFLELSRDQREATLVLGGTPELAPGGKTYNTALVLVGGEVVARYRKVHLFEVALAGARPVRQREADYTVAGDELVVVDTPVGALGLSICYDLRFPELYRALVAAGAEILLAPSAFTVPTGEAHWDLLTRTRAIECQCFLLAPAQSGDHGPASGNRRSYGHSVIVDPWGKRLALLEAGEGLAVARLDASRLAEVRSALPALSHRRLFGETKARRVALSKVDALE